MCWEFVYIVIPDITNKKSGQQDAQTDMPSKRLDEINFHFQHFAVINRDMISFIKINQSIDNHWYWLS